MAKRIHVPGFSRVLARVPKVSPMYRKVWAVQFTPPQRRGYKHPCIFGTRADAITACDADEEVVQIEYRVLKVVKPKKARAA